MCTWYTDFNIKIGAEHHSYLHELFNGFALNLNIFAYYIIDSVRPLLVYKYSFMNINANTHANDEDYTNSKHLQHSNQFFGFKTFKLNVSFALL